MIQRSQKENILTITWFLVKPNERKKEIGKELLQYVVQFAKASNISKIWVEPIPFAEQENEPITFRLEDNEMEIMRGLTYGGHS